MYTMRYDIQIGGYTLGMLDKVEIHSSVELLADTAVITLPAAQYNQTLDVEKKLHRGDKATIRFGYEETGMVEEFTGYLQRISTDSGNITLHLEDELFMLRKTVANIVMRKVTLDSLLRHVVTACGTELSVNCSYAWTYDRFVICDATGYDVLKKVQEECGADIYISNGTLHVHPPGKKVGEQRLYDMQRNVEKESLTYRSATDKKVTVVVKAMMPDGTVKEVKAGDKDGEKVEVRCPATDDDSMKARGDIEVARRTFDGLEGSITTWLIPVCRAGDSATLHDADYPHKDGTYFVTSVTTEFSKDGGKRKIDLGFKLANS